MLRRSAAGNVRYALAAAGVPRGARTARSMELLALVGLAAVAQRPARRLSGGEQQRLALARALAREPEVLFLDEPTASLDPAATKAIEDLIVAVAARGIKVVLSTHDLAEARRLAGEIVLLHRGRVVETARGRVLLHRAARPRRPAASSPASCWCEHAVIDGVSDGVSDGTNIPLSSPHHCRPPRRRGPSNRPPAEFGTAPSEPRGRRVLDPRLRADDNRASARRRDDNRLFDTFKQK